MKIILISGSPRKQGNTAKILEIIKHKIDSKFDVQIIYLSDLQVNGCLGCSLCQQILDEMGCIQNDNVSELLQQLIDADIILYATPLYGHSYSGQLKLFMDRHVSLFKFISNNDKAVNEMEIRSFISDKPVGLIVSCQGPEEQNTELIKKQFDMFCESSLTKCLGKYIFPWCDPLVNESSYSEETLQSIINDIYKL
ncbi:MAG: flavodoxin family protein [Proteocatella sp.]